MNWYPYYRRFGGRQGRSWGAKICQIGIRSRTVQAWVPQSLYRLSYSGPHQSLILLFNSRITPCAHSATSCRQNLRRNSPLRTAKTHSNSLDPIAQLKANTISTRVLSFVSMCNGAGRRSCLSVTSRAEHVGRYREREWLLQSFLWHLRLSQRLDKDLSISDTLYGAPICINSYRQFEWNTAAVLRVCQSMIGTKYWKWRQNAHRNDYR